MPLEAGRVLMGSIRNSLYVMRRAGSGVSGPGQYQRRAGGGPCRCPAGSDSDQTVPDRT